MTVLIVLAGGLSLGCSQRAELDELRERAEQGQASAQYGLGLHYRNGEGVQQDYAEAAKWFRRATEQGHIYASYFLGVHYAQGEGVPQDDVEAARWYRLAAEQGVARAQYELGSRYSTGLGVLQDYAGALKWYRLAVAGGEFYAFDAIGLLYRDKLGNQSEAIKWFRIGAELGISWSMARLQYELEANGELVEAHKWANLRGGIDWELDRITAGMTSDQILEAQRLAREWKPKTWNELKSELGQ